MYAYFRAWCRDGTWERIHHTLYERVRRQSGRQPTPSAAILDSQSVKTTERGGPHGDDGAKKLSGRKRHLLIDTLGLVMKALVHPADIQDRVGARWLLDMLHPTAITLPRLELIWADAGYLGPLQTWVGETFGWRLQIVERPGGRGKWLPTDQEPPLRPAGFQVLPHRWVVERDFAWAARFRRLARDDERLAATLADLHVLAFACLMLQSFTIVRLSL